MALQAGLKRAGRRVSPWEADTKENKKGQSMEAREGRLGGGDSSPFRLADTKLREEDNNNQGLDNNKASHCWFSIVAQTNHYTTLPTSSCRSQVSTNPRQENGEALWPTKTVTCLTPVFLASNSRWETNQLPGERTEERML